MAALTKERDTTEIMQDAKFLHLPVKGGTTIYQGALVALDANGCAIPGKKAPGLTAAGRAEETVENKGRMVRRSSASLAACSSLTIPPPPRTRSARPTSSSLATSRTIRPSPLLRPGLPPLVWSFA